MEDTSNCIYLFQRAHIDQRHTMVWVLSQHCRVHPMGLVEIPQFLSRAPCTQAGFDAMQHLGIMCSYKIKMFQRLSILSSFKVQIG